MTQVMISNYGVGTVITQGTFEPGTFHLNGFSLANYEGNLLLTVHAYPTGTGTVSFTVQGGTVAGSATANWSTLTGSALVSTSTGGTIVFNPVVVGGSIFQQIELQRQYCPPYIRILPVVAQGTFAISALAFGLEKYA